MARILLVDDDIDILILARTIIESRGHDVVTADSVLSALEQLKGREFDLIISDAGMPQLTGFDLLRTLRKEDKFRGIPVAMLTGKRDKEDIKKAIELGVDEYIIKPISPEVLIKKVEDLLSKTNTTKKTPIEANESIKLDRRFQAVLQMNIQIVSLHERGVTLTTDQMLDEGTIVQLISLEWRDLTTDAIKFSVQSTHPFLDANEKEMWRAQMTFVQADERFLSRWRGWLKRQLPAKELQAA